MPRDFTGEEPMFGKRKDATEKARTKEIKAAESALFRAKLEQRLNRELRAAKDEVKKHEKPLAELQSHDVFLSQDNQVRFDKVKVKGTEHPLTTDISSRVEGSGRSLVVLVEATDWGATIEPHPDNVGQAHDFVRALTRQVARLTAGEELVPTELTAARLALTELNAKLQADVDAAAAEVDRVKAQIPTKA
jgi:hypothetical protein